MIGCDVEFEIRNMRDVVESCERYGYSSTGAEIGADGAGSILELRPRPGDEKRVVRNLKDLLSRVDIGNEMLYCWGKRYGIGGHVHVSELSHEYTFKRKIKKYLGKLFMRVNSTLYRNRGSYRELDRFVEQGIGYLEYKTLPSYWLKNPEFAKTVLKVARILGEGGGNGEDELLTVDTYTELGLTKKEAEMLVRETYIPDKRVKYMDVREMWGLIDRHILFKDSWDDTIKEEIFKNVPAEKLLIFGLRESRGDAFYIGAAFPDEVAAKLMVAFESLGWRHVECCECVDWDGYILPAIGVPWSLRMEGKKLDEFIEILNNVLCGR